MSCRANVVAEADLEEPLKDRPNELGIDVVDDQLPVFDLVSQAAPSHPIHIPRLRDAANLSRMRSPITSRSNWANDSRMFNVSRPIDVVVLKDCVTETNVTLC